MDDKLLDILFYQMLFCRDLREEFQTMTNKEQDNILRRKDLEKRLEMSESEAMSTKNDLRLALQRIADLQQAMEEGDSDPTDR